MSNTSLPSKSSKNPSSESAGTILIVDDEPLAHETIKGQLSLENYEVLRANDGLQALEILKTTIPDLIISDVMMPNVNGYELCTQIKESPRIKHVPVVLVTALYSKEDLLRGFDAGADDFISKPVRGTELRARVRSLMRIKRQYDELQNMISLREQLSNMIVHDLKTPLSAIMFSLDYMERFGDVKDDAKEHNGKMLREAQRLNSMIDDLLVTAKSQAGKLQPEMSDCPLQEILSAALDAHSDLAESRDINILREIDLPQDYILRADANLLRRTIDNLLDNALKYTLRKGTVKLSARTLDDEAEETSKNFSVEIEIWDTGQGIPAEYHDRIFDSFEIVSANQKGITQVGLGLAFCKTAIDAHEGKLIIRDNPEGGSIFCITL